MNRIIWHHTGGTHRPNDTDRRAYHLLIAGDGSVHAGRFPIEANAPGRALAPGTYAAHTRGLNTGSVGIAVCAMAGATWRDPGATPHFPTRAQIDALIVETARICRAYGIQPGPRTVLSHAEVEPVLGVAQAGKWDFDYDPLDPSAARDPVEIGDRLRLRVMAALHFSPPRPVPPVRPVLRQGARGAAVEELQRALGITADGIFGPLTRAAVLAFQRRTQLLPDGIVGPMTWAALAALTPA